MSMIHSNGRVAANSVVLTFTSGSGHRIIPCTGTHVSEEGGAVVSQAHRWVPQREWGSASPGRAAAAAAVPPACCFLPCARQNVGVPQLWRRRLTHLPFKHRVACREKLPAWECCSADSQEPGHRETPDNRLQTRPLEGETPAASGGSCPVIAR